MSEWNGPRPPFCKEYRIHVITYEDDIWWHGHTWLRNTDGIYQYITKWMQVK